METNNRYFGWDEIMQAIRLIDPAWLEGVESVYGVMRGGTIPATLISHYFNLTMVEANDVDKNTLIVDNIVDNGKKLKEISDLYFNLFGKEPITYTLCIRNNTRYKPKYYNDIIPHDIWVVFPWERETFNER